MLEAERVAAHIHRGEILAAARDVTPLSQVQRIVRTLLLQALAEYRAEGRFPKNRDFKELTPVFVDAEGTRCAIAHMMELGGAQPLVEKIATERNNARVRELADDPAVVAWLEAAGLTVEEAAAIQPEYCDIRAACVCGSPSGFSVSYPVPARGVLVGTSQPDGMLRVDATYGNALGIVPGDVVVTVDPFRAGLALIAPIDSMTDPVHAIPIGSTDGIYRCTSQFTRNAPALTFQLFTDAVTSPDCVGHLIGQDELWGQIDQHPRCTRPFEQPEDDGGCSASRADASVGILLALVTALARRR